MTEAKIITNTNSIHGIVEIVVVVNDHRERLSLTWKELPDGTGYGFISNFYDGIVRLTDASSYFFLRNLVDRIAEAISSTIDKELERIYIDEKLGRRNEIRFVPPTFNGTVEDIESLVHRQALLTDVVGIFNTIGRRLSADFLEDCQNAGVLDDFLSVLESFLKPIRIQLDCLKYSGE